MMMNAHLALQKALYAALLNDSGVSAALGGAYVFDHTPHSQPFPYITFADVELRPFAAQDLAGTEHALTLEAFSDAKSKKQVLAILSAVEAALEGAIALEGHELVALRTNRITLNRSEDGRIYEARLRLTARTEPLS